MLPKLVRFRLDVIGDSPPSAKSERVPCFRGRHRRFEPNKPTVTRILVATSILRPSPVDLLLGDIHNRGEERLHVPRARIMPEVDRPGHPGSRGPVSDFGFENVEFGDENIFVFPASDHLQNVDVQERIDSRHGINPALAPLGITDPGERIRRGGLSRLRRNRRRLLLTLILIEKTHFLFSLSRPSGRFGMARDIRAYWA